MEALLPTYFFIKIRYVHTFEASQPTNPTVQMLTPLLDTNRWSILIGLLVVVLLSVAAWVFAPKGENQTYVLPTGTESLWMHANIGDQDLALNTRPQLR